MISKKETFVRAQISAFAGGLLDYLFMISLTEFMNVHYTQSILISGSLGAILNFWINRYWTYQTQPLAIGYQLLKFSLVVAGSILLKSSGTWMLSSWMLIDYKISRLITDLIVAIGFNYTLQTYWVFKKEIPI